MDEVLGLEGCDGVVRVSMVHYNTGEFLSLFFILFAMRRSALMLMADVMRCVEEEVRRYVEVLDGVLA